MAKKLCCKNLYLIFAAFFLLSSCVSKSAPLANEATPSMTFAPAQGVPSVVSAVSTATPFSTRTPAPTLAIDSPTIGSTTTGIDNMTLLFVPEGEFTMGSDANSALADCQNLRSDCRLEWFTNAEPSHSVYLDSFWIDETEVTNKQYADCVDAKKCKPPFQNNSHTRGSYFRNPVFDNYPVIYVSWENAESYCQWAGRRLPTEAEWEKAARGTDGRVYPWGNEPPSNALLNYGLNAGDTTKVKGYPKGVSPYGAYDMSGNVWEWTSDWYDENYYRASPSSNPSGPETGTDKVSRSSAWVFYDFDVRATDRYGNYPKTTNNVIGFRCARDR